MNFSLIVCTYMRPETLLNLLNSVKKQSLYPNEIIIVDGSLNDKTQHAILKNSFKNLKYYKVDAIDIGLTKQRNYGIKKVSINSAIVCFLDDDIVLDIHYFKNIMQTYDERKDAIAVGGYITNEVKWKKASSAYKPKKAEFYREGWYRKEPSRIMLSKNLGLFPNNTPGFMPMYSHGRSVGFFPPSNKVYETELFMGGVASYKKQVFENLKFSLYFEGYSLYEDIDFCLKLSKQGKLYINTAARCNHYHNVSGRPNKFKYGKMVLRNGWYVWRVKYPKPTIKNRIKWNLTALLLTLVRVTNIINTNRKKEALNESLGRVFGWLSLIFNKPKIQS